jgi:hypothetical protein
LKKHQLWPTPQDYNETIQNPRVCFDDPDLSTGSVELNALGLPKAASGTFASVYKVKSPTGNWAVRCFLTDRQDQEERYKSISEFILFDDLDCTVDFHYASQGIKLGGAWYPILKMPWIEGPTLENYLIQIINDKAKLTALKNDFFKLSMALERAGIAHGDLQHGNIIVSPSGLRLVDYDALFVPKLLGKRNLEFGHPNYQHPLRDEYHFDVSVDNFSSWLIYTSLSVLTIDPSLFSDFSGGDDCILFKRADLHEPESSKLFAALDEHRSEEIRELSKKLRGMLWLLPHMVPALDATDDELQELPKEKQPTLDFTPSADATDSKSGASRKRASSASSKQRSASVSPKLRGLGKLARDVFHSTAKKASPRYYITLRTLDGNDFIKKAAYEEAHECFIKVREMHASTFPEEKQQEIALLLKITHCALQMETPSNAENYWLLAAQIATDLAVLSHEKHKRRVNVGKTLNHKSQQQALNDLQLKSLEKFYKSLSDFLRHTARRGGNGKGDVAKSFAQLIDDSGSLVSNAEVKIVLIAVFELVPVLIASGRFKGSPDNLKEAITGLLRYSGLWHASNSCQRNQKDYRQFWTNLADSMRHLASTSDDPVLKMRAEIAARVESQANDRETPEFIESINLDRDTFKTALLQSCKSANATSLLNGLIPSLRSLKKKDPWKYEQTVLWLWREVVFEKAIPHLALIQWLKNFKNDLAEKCWDKELQLKILANLETEYRSTFSYLVYVEQLLLALQKLGPGFWEFSETVLTDMVDRVKSKNSEFTYLQVETAKSLVLRFAGPYSPNRRFAETYEKPFNPSALKKT